MVVVVAVAGIPARSARPVTMAAASASFIGIGADVGVGDVGALVVVAAVALSRLAVVGVNGGAVAESWGTLLPVVVGDVLFLVLVFFSWGMQAAIMAFHLVRVRVRVRV